MGQRRREGKGVKRRGKYGARMEKEWDESSRVVPQLECIMGRRGERVESAVMNHLNT